MIADRADNNTRVLRALRAAGGAGITASDFLAPTLDGLPPVLRLAVCVHRLRRQGFAIDSSRRRRGGQAVYVLISDPEDVCPS